MSELQILVTFVVFAAVILIIAFNILDISLAGMLGVSALIVFGVLTVEDILNIVRTSGSTMALLFGGMIVARTLKPSGIFDRIGSKFLQVTRGSGKRFLLGLVILVAGSTWLLTLPLKKVADQQRSPASESAGRRASARPPAGPENAVPKVIPSDLEKALTEFPYGVWN